jgi:xanthine dehydrogenase accessory factor
MTHDHQMDQAAIEWAIARGFGFVGGVGSRGKAARTRQRLEAKGVAEVDVARVRMPLGVEIGARSPAEIGVAIAAELIEWRARDHGRARRERGASRREAPGGASTAHPEAELSSASMADPEAEPKSASMADAEHNGAAEVRS